MISAAAAFARWCCPPRFLVGQFEVGRGTRGVPTRRNGSLGIGITGQPGSSGIRLERRRLRRRFSASLIATVSEPIARFGKEGQ